MFILKVKVLELLPYDESVKMLAWHLRSTPNAMASYPYTTACYPHRIALPGADIDAIFFISFRLIFSPYVQR